jgi:hypothetical protein
MAMVMEMVVVVMEEVEEVFLVQGVFMQFGRR